LNELGSWLRASSKKLKRAVVHSGTIISSPVPPPVDDARAVQGQGNVPKMLEARPEPVASEVAAYQLRHDICVEYLPERSIAMKLACPTVSFARPNP
jgi:hypothetical protein